MESAAAAAVLPDPGATQEQTPAEGLTQAEVISRRARGLGNDVREPTGLGLSVQGDLFALTPLAAPKWALVLGVFVAWFLVLRETWRLRLIERFVGS